MIRVSVQHVNKRFQISFIRKQSFLHRLVNSISGHDMQKTIRVLDDVSLDINAGEIVGLIGANGSGKSTLLRTIAKIYSQDSGDIITEGKIISLINLNVGLKDRLTMKENIFLVGSLFGMGQEEIKEKFDVIVHFSELGEFVNTKLYQFSSGMLQRLAFSIAIHANPKILLLDEVFEVGDENFRKRSSEKNKALAKDGCSIILVSHDMEMMTKYCHRIAWLDHGRVKRYGDAKSTINAYLTKEDH
jgi:ABC-2 type transport system ATP-binding protein